MNSGCKWLYLSMETLIINIPEKKTALVKQLLKELGVTFRKKTEDKSNSVSNAVTQKVIDDAHKRIGIGQPIQNIDSYIDSL